MSIIVVKDIVNIRMTELSTNPKIQQMLNKKREKIIIKSLNVIHNFKSL